MLKKSLLVLACLSANTALAQKIYPPQIGTGAYFGAYVSPNPTQSPISQTANLEATIGRKLQLHMHYFDWTDSTFANNRSILDDITNGRVPVISWACGADDYQVSQGLDDAAIDAEASTIKAFRVPMIVRWFWEMNNGGSGGSTQQDCLNHSYSRTQQQAYFIAAWQHIWQRFQLDGVTNVTWLWNPFSTSGQYGKSTTFYPGNTYVDWIGDDDYGYQSPYNSFSNVFSSFYSTFAGSAYGPPLMLGETGGCPSVNGAYVASANQALANGVFPKVGAFMYWDSIGSYPNCPSASTVPWVLTTYGTPTGISAFEAMGASAYFNPSLIQY